MEVCNKATGAQIEAWWGGIVRWTCNYCRNQFRSTYYLVKGHLLGLPCELATCKAVNATQRNEMEKEDTVCLGNVAATSKKIQKHHDPIPFVRNPSSKFGNEAEIQPPKIKKNPNIWSNGQDLSTREVRWGWSCRCIIFLSQLHFIWCCTIAFVHWDVSISNWKGSNRVCASKFREA